MGRAGTASTVTYKLRIPEELSDHYSERAAKAGQDPEHEMLKTLSRCRDHNSASPIYVGDSARNELSQITGRLLKNESDLVDWAKNAVTIRVQGIDVPLSSTLITRLQSRCFGSTFEELIRRVTVQTLEEYVGLR